MPKTEKKNFYTKAGRNMLGYVECRGTIDEARYQLQEEMMEIKSSEADFCTHVDIENEKLVMEGIQHQFPTHKIIGEESVGTGTVPPLTKERTWIIDPIDGTTNFSQGINLTCVSIGLCDNGKPVMGVVYAPATNELFYAVTSLGSYRNGRRITQRLTDKKLQKAVICCEFGYSRREKEIDAMLGVVKDILQHGCRAIRQFGSGVLDLCYVATGKLDIVYAGVANEGWKPWDYCAGKVICDEAGCIMENFDQQPDDDFDLYGKSIICGINRHLVDECRKLVLKHQI